MSTEKTAGVFGPSASETEAALQKFYGDKLLNSAGAGAGLGIGATALYHLLRGAKPVGKKEKKYPGYGSGTPMIAKQAVAMAPSCANTQNVSAGAPANMQPTQFAQQHAHLFNGGAEAAQARFNELSSQGFFNGAAPAAAQGAGKVAFDINRVKEILGGALPTTMVPFSAPSLGGGGAPSADPHAWRKSWSTAANLGGAGLGALAGGHLVNSIVKSKKKRDQSSALEAARQEYYNALRGKHASLDAAFESVKSANLLTSTISGAFQAPQALRTAYLLSMLGAGGLGAKYMYDKTKQTTEGENLAKAQASRARTRGLPPIYVDPEGLANVKAIAENDG
jgi:hypothetical protein